MDYLDIKGSDEQRNDLMDYCEVVAMVIIFTDLFSGNAVDNVVHDQRCEPKRSSSAMDFKVRGYSFIHFCNW